MAGSEGVAGDDALQKRLAALESDLEQAKADLRAERSKDAWFKGLVEIAPDTMLVHGADQKIVYINPAGIRMFGAASADQIIGTLASSLVHPDSRQSLVAQISGVLGGAMPSFSILDQRRMRLDGTDFHADMTATGIIWNDKPAALIVVRDISDRVRARAKYEQADEQRRQAHAMLLDAIEAMPEGFALFDADDRLQIYNSQYADRFSGNKDGFIAPGVKFSEIVDETIKSGMLAANGDEAAKQALDHHRNLPSLQEVQYKSGEWVRRSKKRTRDGGVVSVYTDITDLKVREQALRDSELRHRQMLEALPDAVIISVDEKIVFVNAAAVAMFGAEDAADLVGRHANSFVPTDLRDAHRERRRKVLTERCTLPPTEQQRLRLDGTTFDVESVLTYMVWESKPGFLGVLRDISARKEAEKTLAETSRRLSAVADHILGAVYQQVRSSDGKFSFSYVSAGVYEVTGLTPGQITGDASVFLKTVRDDFRDEYQARFRQSADQMVPLDFEFPIHGPEGTVRWLHATGRPQRRLDGAVVWDGIMIDVTDKKIAQENANRNYEWLLQAIGSMPSGFMLWDPDDRLVLWNKRIAGYHPDPDIFREGLPFEDMLVLPFEDAKSRLGEKAADEWLKERRRQHKTARGTHEFQGKGGTWFNLRERRTPEGFTVTLLTDVSEQHQNQVRLLESEERYRTMIDLSPDAIYVHKLGIIVVCNEAAMKLFGATSPDQLIGRELLDFTHPDDREAAGRRRSAVVEAGTRTLASRQKRLRLDGSWFWAEVAAAAIYWEGERGGVVVLRDVSDQITAEEELIRSKEEAELANRAKTEFLANISHELRTPLNAIIGFSDLMQREMLGPLGNAQYASYIRDIHQSGTHLHDVINDILDLSKIEAGQMELQEKPVDIRRSIERCIRIVAARADENGLKLISKLPDTLPFVIADERKIKQIMINLISNAVKFTEAGGTITVEAEAGADIGVTIRVTDTGIGIAPENILKVFRPFEQVDSSLSRSHEGTGLGLPLTRSLVELHGGTLDLESQLGIGTTVIVRLPAHRLSDRPLAAE